MYRLTRFARPLKQQKHLSTAVRASVEHFEPLPPVSKPRKSVRFHYAKNKGKSLEFGFTDGSAYRFQTMWLRHLVTGFDASQTKDAESARAARAELIEGAAGVALHWDSPGADKRGTNVSTLDANMLRAFADSVAETVPQTDLSARLEPISGPCVWTGAELAESPWWGVMLSAEQIDDLVRATKAAAPTAEWRAPGVPETIAREDFQLGEAMREVLAGVATEVEFGKGLAMIRNMPVDDPRLTEDELAVMYVGLSAHIGHVVMQSSSGLRSVSRGYGCALGRIQAEMTGETPKGGLQTNNHFRLHTDRCDVISLMSLRTAPSGGASRVCSAPAVFNAILERAPELAQALTEPIDRIWEGEKGYFRLPVVGTTPSGQFTTQISPSYVENAQFLDGAATGARKATATQIAALDAIEEIGMELGAEFLMKPGMLYFLNNHQVYHGRGNWSVTDSESSGEWGQTGRLLFRTWISPYNSRPLPDTELYRTIWGDVRGGQPRGGWDQAVKTGDSPKPAIPADHKYYSLFDDRVQQKSMNEQCGTVLTY